MDEIIKMILAETEAEEIRIGLWQGTIIEGAEGEEMVQTYYAEAFRSRAGYGALSEAWQEIGSVLGASSIHRALMDLAEELLPERKFEVLAGLEK